MFYGRSRQGVTLENFMQQIAAYMIWYRDEQIKLSLGGLSPEDSEVKWELPFSSIKCPHPLIFKKCTSFAPCTI